MPSLTTLPLLKNYAIRFAFNPTYAINTGDGLAGEVDGQPSIPTWLGRRIFSLISLGNIQADIDGKAIRSSAGIIAFVSEHNDETNLVAAGRAYQRLALQANALNVCNAFINQPIEVRSLHPQLHAWLDLRQQHVDSIVRAMAVARLTCTAYANPFKRSSSHEH